MAIVKRKSKSGIRYQAKVKGTDGSWITETFDSRVEAEQWEARLKLDKLGGKSPAKPPSPSILRFGLRKRKLLKFPRAGDHHKSKSFEIMFSR